MNEHNAGMNIMQQRFSREGKKGRCNCVAEILFVWLTKAHTPRHILTFSGVAPLGSLLNTMTYTGRGHENANTSKSLSAMAG
jgi:hypothetical protein